MKNESIECRLYFFNILDISDVVDLFTAVFLSFF